MSETKAVPVNMEAADMLHELFTVLFRQKFGREPGPDDPVVFDPHADTPQRLTNEKHAQLLADMGAAAGLPPHFVYAMRQTGFIVTESNKSVMPKQKIEEWERAMEEYFQVDVELKPVNP